MSESQHQQGQTRLLLNIAMVILETFYSFILKHDRVVRLQAKKFVEQQITIKMNSYIPFFDFYIQFIIHLFKESHNISIPHHSAITTPITLP